MDSSGTFIQWYSFEDLMRIFGEERAKKIRQTVPKREVNGVVTYALERIIDERTVRFVGRRAQ